MNTNSKQNIRLRIILISFLLSCIFIILTTPLHEAAHWIMSDIDPYSKPVEFHLFDDELFQNGESILSLSLGCVIIRESYQGSFKDRPTWIDPLQEVVCISIQIILTCMIVTKMLMLLIKKQSILSKTSKLNF